MVAALMTILFQSNKPLVFLNMHWNYVPFIKMKYAVPKIVGAASLEEML